MDHAEEKRNLIRLINERKNRDDAEGRFKESTIAKDMEHASRVHGELAGREWALSQTLESIERASRAFQGSDTEWLSGIMQGRIVPGDDMAIIGFFEAINNVIREVGGKVSS